MFAIQATQLKTAVALVAGRIGHPGQPEKEIPGGLASARLTVIVPGRIYFLAHRCHQNWRPEMWRKGTHAQGQEAAMRRRAYAADIDLAPPSHRDGQGPLEGVIETVQITYTATTERIVYRIELARSA